MFESINKRTLIIAGSSIVGFFLVVLLITAIIGWITPNYLSYEKFEEKLANAAKKYYQANPSFLPATDGEITLYYSTLELEEYMPPMIDILEDAESCNAEVIVTRYAENFSYIPYLVCPDYETKEMYKKVLEDNKIMTDEKGLYRGSDGYYFRGEVTNNYISLEDQLWKIIKINNDNSMTIIADEPTLAYYQWDNRYNLDEKASWGINDFELSRVKDTLKTLAIGNEIFSDKTKSKLVARNLCIGKRSLDDTDSTGSIECSTITEDKYLLGLITASEYMAASLDGNCDTILSKSCTNYNFLATRNTPCWSITGLSEDTKYVLYYSKNGAKKMEAAISQALDLTAFISRRAFYESGIGTKADPYILK